MLELAVVLRDQRVGGRDRRVGHAGEHRAEGEQQVLDVVVGEDGDRPLDRERMREQPLGDRAGGDQRLGVAHPAPVAALDPLGDEGAIGRDLGPVQEAVGQARGVGLERLLGDDQGRAVVALRQRRLERAAERQVAIARAAAHLALAPMAAAAAHAFFTFCGLAFEEIAHPALGGVVALGDRRHQRFGEQALVLAHVGDARQGVHDREVRERRIAGDAAGELERLGQALAGLDPVLREADRLAFVGVVDAAGEHHVGHPRDADQARDPRRAAAADEEAALAFGQAVEGARLGDAHVAGARQLQAAADHGAVQDRDHRHPAELDLVERRMPGARMQDAFGDAALRELGEVEAGAEVLALAAEHDRAHGFGQVDEGGVQLRHQRVVDRVALGRAIQAQVQHGAPFLDAQQVERPEERRRGRCGACHWLVSIIMIRSSF